MNEEEWTTHFKKLNEELAHNTFCLRITGILVVVCAALLVLAKLWGW